MNSILDEISDKLESLLDGQIKMEGVWFGQCRAEKLKNWNYFVYNRAHMTKNNASKNDFQPFYQVHIVHEEYIPEGYIEQVIETIESPGTQGLKLKVTSDDILFNYIFKGRTDMVVEIATITIYHPQKRK